MRQQHAKQTGGEGFEHLSLTWELKNNAVWARFQHPERPCISQGLLTDLGHAQQLIEKSVREGLKEDISQRIHYQILASDLPGVFNVGGDLALFIRLVRAQQWDELFSYAKSCIDIVYASATGYDLPLTTIALVQGEALGGGFEAALSANVLIAEKSARFGFPETVFGMFPGMGAFSFLARRVTPTAARRIIESGKIYTADELYQMGIVDQVVADGRGEVEVQMFIQHRQNRVAGFQGLDSAIDQFNPLTYKELIDVASIWVETAKQLSEKNLRLMEYLVRAQEKRWCSQKTVVEDTALQETA